MDPAHTLSCSCSTCQRFDAPTERYLESAYVDRAGEYVTQIFWVLDRALELHRQRVAFAESCKGLPFYNLPQSDGHLITLFEDRSPGSEYAMRLWAGAHGFSLQERMHYAPEYQQRFRVLSVVVGTNANSSAVRLADWQGPSEWREPETREPAPGVVVELPRTERDKDGMWRPSDGGQL